MQKLQIEVGSGGLSAENLLIISDRLVKTNILFYRLTESVSDINSWVLGLANQLNLHSIDGNLCAGNDAISEISTGGSGAATEYIPYTNKPLSWHTDGYYNMPSEQVRAILMHCVRPAEKGGENAFLDHELAYILLRDESPRFIQALMESDVFRIPANVQNGVVIRPEYSGPVFSVNDDGSLHMRFSARAKNIVWKDDLTTRNAVDFLLNLLAGKSPYILRYRLNANEGIISNNILHNRTAFQEVEAREQRRLLLRARFHDRISINQ
ncbi:MAG: TauD/TfdA family dioxygenase [Gammaproteobacteria bacterium]